MSVKHDTSTNVPLTTLGSENESKFTFKDLKMLNDRRLSFRSPLSTIALCDMNAFFAQVERVRLELTDEDPVVCVQWNSLIAVSYAAKKFGIGRMDNIQSAVEKCPEVILAHAAVFKKGNSYWSYYDELPEQGAAKVSLDPYRREGRKIVNLYKKHCDFVEKSSVDESYLDLGRLVYKKLIDLFPQLNSSDDLQHLPSIPKQLPIELQWKGVIYESEREVSHQQIYDHLSDSQKDFEPSKYIFDWDDICILIGSQILYKIRKIIYDELGYTTSGGVANNKLVAKLAAGFRKPDCQTIIRNQSINKFLTNFKLNDISGLGGKLGDSIFEKFNLPEVNSITYLRDNFALKDIEQEFKNDLPFAKKLYEIVRGINRLELTERSDVKSMMSRKNFMSKAPVDNFGDAYDWLLVFAGDLYNRMIELDDEAMHLSMTNLNSKSESVRRPKTLSIQITVANYSTRSKQVQLPICTTLIQLKEVIQSHSLALLKQLVDSVCNLSLLNGGRPIKDILQDPEIHKVKCIKIISMGLIISNFVKTNTSFSIDIFAGKAGEDNASISKRLPEYNDSKTGNEVTPPISKKQDIDKEYISKLFADFEREDNTRSPEAMEATMKPKKPLDREYINKLFDDFNKEKLPGVPKDTSTKSITKSPSLLQADRKEETRKRAQPKPSKAASKKMRPNNDIVENLRLNQVPSNTTNSKICTKCKARIENTREHLDYHFAMELSERINT